MSGCYGSDPEDRYFEQLLFDYLEAQEEVDEEEFPDEWEQEYYLENILAEGEYKDEQL